jgi:ATP-dependent protease ClpP protease subunit
MQIVLEPERQEIDSIWEEYVAILQKDDNYYVHLTEEIGSPSEYNKLCHLLDSAESNHTIYIIINSPGGISDSAFMIINSMINSKAKIVGRITGNASSAVTMIAMYCDELIVDRFATMMCHNYNHGTQGSGNEVKTYVDFIDKEFTSVVKEVYKDFLTPAEMKKVSGNDKAVWLNEHEIRTRWDNKVASRLADKVA